MSTPPEPSSTVSPSSESTAPTTSPSTTVDKVVALAARASTPIDVANKSLQMVALLVAGIWAYWTWQQATEPGLGTGIAVASQPKTTWNDQLKYCTAQVLVEVENIGTRNVQVAKANYEIFKAPRRFLNPGESFKFLKYPPEGKTNLSMGQLTPIGTLVHVYPPKAKSSQSLDFLLGPEEIDDVFFSVELLDGKGKRLGDQYGGFEPCIKPPRSKQNNDALPAN